MRFRIVLLLLTAVYSLLTYRSSTAVAGPMKPTVSNLTTLAEAMAYHREAYLLCLSLMSERNTKENSKASPATTSHPQVPAGFSSIRLHLTHTLPNRWTRTFIPLTTSPTASSSAGCISPADHDCSALTVHHHVPEPTKSYAESACSTENNARVTARPPFFQYMNVLTEEEEDDIIRAVREMHQTERKRFIIQLWLFIGGVFAWWWALFGW
ncbi:hypothetical protein DFP73DRAFT_524697 [Morchella snyderi]|nr:hypothetical protein DFP73DRAFT_524697 [Morchella snyderi]